MIAWIKAQWAKRPWLLGLIAGGLVAAGYWVYTKSKGTSATGDATGVVSVPQVGSDVAGGGDSSGNDVVSALQDFADAVQQSQQANTDLLSQQIVSGESANSSFFSSMQSQLDNLASVARSMPNISQQVAPVPAITVVPTVPSPVVVASPNPTAPSIPVYAAPAIAVITQAAAVGLLTPAAAKNMTAAVTATPVPVGTPTGAAISVPGTPYPTGVSVAQGLAMATAFASTPYTPPATPSPAYKAPAVSTPAYKAPTSAPIKKIVGHTVVSA